MAKEIEILYSENRIKLNPSSSVFRVVNTDGEPYKRKRTPKRDAERYAWERRSYVGRCYNQYDELIGYYVPA